jgi:hypothetical protein
MTSESQRWSRAALSVGFAVAYGLGAAFSGNQNSYLLHAFAEFDGSALRHDWVANTQDPFPLFTALMAPLLPWGPTAVLAVGQLALIAVYAYALTSIVEQTLRERASGRAVIATCVALAAVHSRLLASVSMRVLHTDARALLTEGVASQYLLGPGLQPSVFGVLLIVSISFYLAGRPFLAVACACAAALVHPTYLLSAALLTLCYAADAVRTERGAKRGVALAGMALLLVLPAVLYAALAFRPSAAFTFQRANAILVHSRLPLHADVAVWFGASAVCKIALIVVALIAVRGRPLFRIMVVAFTAGILLTVAQWITASDALALLFPWRVSTWLVPIATAIIIGSLIVRWPPRASVALACAVPLAIYGVAGTVHESREAAARADIPVTTFASDNRAAIDTYLVPPELFEFRLRARTPIVVDAKTHPYKDTEIIEWDDRLRAARGFYAAVGSSRCGTLAGIVERWYPTRVVIPADTPLVCDGAREVYRDRAFAVYAIASPPANARRE